MDSSKSQVDFYVDLLEQLLCRDQPLPMGSRNLKRDVETLQFRTSHEGMSFLTKTLPKLGKAFDQGLASTRFVLPLEFKCSHGNRSIPAFMQEYFNRVFDSCGNLLDEANPDDVKHIRQVLFFVYKLELPYTQKQNEGVVNAFVATDAGLQFTDDIEANQVIEVASYIVQDIFEGFDPKDISPRHGPGAVATGERLEDKWIFHRLYNDIHQVYPYYDYFIVGGGLELMDRLEWYKSLERLDHGRAKVVLVPKDSRGPRLISCEPLEFQWVQQGLGRKIIDHLEHNKLTRGQINFEHQDINRDLALESSYSLKWATLDLKDASDRVSLELVKRVFSKTPFLLRALLACRSSATLLPDGREVTLNKYAPMGSALCFPVEAICFWAICVAAISRHRRLRRAYDSTQKDESVEKEVFVYGDDIIVPTKDASLCVQSLEYFGLLVNRSKCCIQGPFRESCGMDAFRGVCVTPIRAKVPWNGRKTDGSAYASYIHLANELFARGYTLCSNKLWGELKSVYGDIPYGTSVSSYPCVIVSDAEEAERLNLKRFRHRKSGRYQRIEFLVLKLRSKVKKSKLDGWPRMLRNLLIPPFEDPSSVVVPRSTIINRGWTPVY